MGLLHLLPDSQYGPGIKLAVVSTRLFTIQCKLDAQSCQTRTFEVIKRKKLSKFLSDAADGLIRVERKPGRPSLEDTQRQTSRKTPVEVQPVMEIRLDTINTGQ